MKFEELDQKLKQIGSLIETLAEEDDWTGFIFSLEDPPTNPEDEFLLTEYSELMQRFFHPAFIELKNLQKPIYREGFLHKNAHGRYELDDFEFSCGTRIEAYIFDKFDEKYHWLNSRIEHNGHDYYIVGYEGNPEKVFVRTRK